MNKHLSFGATIFLARKRKHLIVSDLLSKISEGSISKAYISSIETGKTIPNLKVIKILSQLLDIDENELINKAVTEKIEEYTKIMIKRYSTILDKEDTNA